MNLNSRSYIWFQEEDLASHQQNNDKQKKKKVTIFWNYNSFIALLGVKIVTISFLLNTECGHASISIRMHSGIV